MARVQVDVGVPARQVVDAVRDQLALPGAAEVVVEVLEKAYQTGRKYAEGFKEGMKIVFDEFLPRWNYRAVPSSP